MIYLRKKPLLLLLFALLYSFSLSYSTLCCYNFDSDQITTPLPGVSSCSDREFLLGEAGSFPECVDKFIASSCVTPDGSCLSPDSFGKDFLLNKYEVNDNGDFSNQNMISDLLTFFQSMGITYYNDCSFVRTCPNPQSGGSTGTGDSDSNSQDITPPRATSPVSQPIVTYEVDIQNLNGNQDPLDLSYDSVCKSLGGVGGFYTTADLCNNFETTRNPGEIVKPCVYNPKTTSKLGLLNSNINFIFKNIFEESSCVAKTKIQFCSDYTTKESCENNFAYDLSNNVSSRSPELRFGCEWVPSTDYQNSFENINGFCQKKDDLHGKTTFEEYYLDRKNVIPNPSFETSDLNSYSLSGGEDVSQQITSTFPFHGNNALYLKDQSLLITVDDIGFGYYAFLAHIKPAEIGGDYDFQVSYSIDGNEWTDTPIYHSKESPLQAKSKDINPYVTLPYQLLFGSSDNKNINTVTLKLTVTGEVYLDALHLEYLGKKKNYISFSPVEVVNPLGSSCYTCFTSLGYNTCTQEKSDLLGDCSYMVENSSEPYGIFKTDSGHARAKNITNNPYLQEIDYNSDNFKISKWSSQSLENGNLFCELYTSEEQCINEDNYVNSKYSIIHPYSGSTLCKWNSSFGCYKDSNNDNLPDTSDYRLSCDQIPPITYLYFYGTNASGNFTQINLSNIQDVGNVNVYYSIFDRGLENSFACENIITLDQQNDNSLEPSKTTITISNETGVIAEYVLGEANTLFERSTKSISLKELLGDGITYSQVGDISIEIKDQSENIAFSNTLDTSSIDFEGPSIDLTSHENFLAESVYEDNILTNYIRVNTITITPRNSLFNFTVQDKNGINKCKVFVEDSGKNPKEISSIDQENALTFEVLFEELYNISNLDPFSNTMYLHVDCYDIFSQKTENVYVLESVNFLTDFNLESPRPLFHTIVEENYSSDDIFLHSTGYLSKPTVINISSTEKELTCTITSQDGSYSGSSQLESDGSFENIQEEKTYYYYTGTLSFSENGFHTIQVSCTDEDGVQHSQNLTYIYDTTPPEKVSVEPFEENKAFYEPENRWYVVTIGKKIPKTRIVLNGTFSWGNNSVVNLTGIDNHPVTYSLLHVTYTIPNMSNPNINHFNFNTNYTLEFNEKLGIEKETNLPGVAEISYIATLADKAGNRKAIPVSLYWDKTNPRFNFTGFNSEIITQDSNKLYTKEKDPNMYLHFNTPEYRTYNCSFKYDGGDFTSEYSEVYTNVNHINFKLSDITKTTVDLSNSNPNLLISCVDMFGIELGPQTFSFVYDITPPVLEKIQFQNTGNSFYKFLSSFTSSVYPISNETLQLVLKDTNEEFLSCSYRIVKDEPLIPCNQSIISSQTSNPGTIFEFTGINFVNGIIAGEYDNQNDYRCEYVDSFRTQTKQAIDSSEDKKKTYHIDIEARCTDAVGLTTNKTQPISLIFSSNTLAAVVYSYDKTNVIPTVYSFSSGDPQNFRFKEVSNSGLGYVTTLQGRKQELEGINKYDFQGALDLTEFKDNSEGIKDVEVSLKDDSTIKTLSKVIVDYTNPQINTLEVAELIDGFLTSENGLISIQYSDNLEQILSEYSITPYSNVTVTLQKKNEEPQIIYNYENGILESPYTTMDVETAKETNIEIPIHFNFNNQNTFGTYNVTVVVKDAVGNTKTQTKTFEVQPFGLVLKTTPENKIFVNPKSRENFYTKGITSSDTISLDIIPIEFKDKTLCDDIKIYTISDSQEEALVETIPSSSVFTGFTLPSSLLSNLGITFESLRFDVGCEYDNTFYAQRSLNLYLDDFPLTISSMSIVDESSSPISFFNYPNSQTGYLKENTGAISITVNNSELKPFVSCTIVGNNSEYYTTSSSLYSEKQIQAITTDITTLLGENGFYAFTQNLKETLGGEQPLHTNITFTATCTDIVENTATHTLTFPVNYINSGILDVEFEQDSQTQGKVSVIGYQLVENPTIKIFKTSSDEELTSFTGTGDDQGDGTLKYTSNSFDISQLEPREEITIKIIDSNQRVQAQEILQHGFDLEGPDVKVTSDKSTFTTFTDISLEVKDQSLLSSISIKNNIGTVIFNKNIETDEEISESYIRLVEEEYDESTRMLSLMFSHNRLSNGENSFTIIAKDEYGFETEKQFSIFKKQFDISLTNKSEVILDTTRNIYVSQKENPLLQIEVKGLPNAEFVCSDIKVYDTLGNSKTFSLETIDQEFSLGDLAFTQSSVPGDERYIDVECKKVGGITKIETFEIAYKQLPEIETQSSYIYDLGYPYITFSLQDITKNGFIYGTYPKATISIKSKSSTITNLSIYLNNVNQDIAFTPSNSIIKTIPIEEGIVRVTATDAAGRSFTTSKLFINNPQELSFIAIDGFKSKALTANSWYVDTNQPFKLRVLSSTAFDSCRMGDTIVPFEDDRENVIVIDSSNINISSEDDTSITVDCTKGSITKTFYGFLILRKPLPDFTTAVIDSSGIPNYNLEDFIFDKNENYTLQAISTSISPSNFQKCSIINVETSKGIGSEDFSLSTNVPISFSQDSEFVVVCSDKLGKEHYAHYNTRINEVEDIELISMEYGISEYKLPLNDGSAFLVNVPYKVSLIFNRNDLNCSFEAIEQNEGESFITSTINFFKRVFSSGIDFEVTSKKSFEYDSDIDFDTVGLYALSLSCTTPTGESYEQANMLVNVVNSTPINLSYSL
jgi:hypothetical protein